MVSRFFRAGVRLGLVIGVLRKEIRPALCAVGWEKLFSVVIAAEVVAQGKPDPEGYRRALGLLNREPQGEDSLIHPHEVVAIGDSPAGIEGALEAGLYAIAVAHTSPPERLQRVSKVYPRLAEVDPQRTRSNLSMRASFR